MDIKRVRILVLCMITSGSKMKKNKIATSTAFPLPFYIIFKLVTFSDVNTVGD